MYYREKGLWAAFLRFLYVDGVQHALHLGITFYDSKISSTFSSFTTRFTRTRFRRRSSASRRTPRDLRSSLEDLYENLTSDIAGIGFQLVFSLNASLFHTPLSVNALRHCT